YVFVDSYGSSIPTRDDLEMTLWVDPAFKLNWADLWVPANEHRVLLPRLIFYALLLLTHDFRSAMFFQVWVLGLLALGTILFARKLRGRTSYTDAFFPLFWLHWGNAENLVLGMQITIAVPTLLVCTAIGALAWRPQAPGWRRGALLGLCLLLLPLNGGF